MIFSGQNRGWFPAVIGGVLAVLCSVFVPMGVALAKPPKPAKPPEPEKPAAPAILPADLNLASLRVTALDTMYQFDFSEEQLRVLLAESNGSGSTAVRPAAPANEKLSVALNELARALLDAKDDAQIAKLRNDVIDLVTEDGSGLNDELQPTAHANASAPKVFVLLKSTQIATYLATHAHEVGDPQEVISGAMDELRDNRAEDPDGKNAQLVADANTLIQETATDVGFLVAGLDDARAKTVGDQITALLKSVYAMKDADFKAQRGTMDASIKQIVGDVPAMQVLSNWIQRQIAVLLSNPQLSPAITARLKADAAQARAPATP